VSFHIYFILSLCYFSILYQCIFISGATQSGLGL
jgi:hypothetical protein